jgi:small subunit ribosomal protein S5e
MSDNGEIEVESPAGYAVLPKEVTDEIGSIKLFNKARQREIYISARALY